MSKYDTLFSNFNQPIAQVLLSRSDLTEVIINYNKKKIINK